MLQISVLVVAGVFLIRSLATLSKQIKYEQNADEMFEEIIGVKIYETKKKIIENPADINISASENKFKVFTEPKDVTKANQNPDGIEPATTIPLEATREPNMTQEMFDRRKEQLEVEYILSDGSYRMDFETDGVALHTSRFDKIQLEAHQKNGYRRDLYTSRNKFFRKKKYISLMQHFIYRIRYKMTYMQFLQKKYKEKTRYKIGFLFAILRNIKYKQELLFHAFNHNKPFMQNLMVPLRIYDKMGKFGVDVKDLNRLIRNLSYQAKLDDDPFYYVGFSQ